VSGECLKAAVLSEGSLWRIRDGEIELRGGMRDCRLTFLGHVGQWIFVLWGQTQLPKRVKGGKQKVQSYFPRAASGLCTDPHHATMSEGSNRCKLFGVNIAQILRISPYMISWPWTSIFYICCFIFVFALEWDPWPSTAEVMVSNGE
jgi:hypothetical protein